MMLERGLEARFAKSVFYEHVNDIDVFVEDTSAETRKLFAKLLSRNLGSFSIDCVFPVGARIDVLTKCGADQGHGGRRRRVYVIDADMDLCRGIDAPRLRRLYRLPRYCVENFLIEEVAAARVLARNSEELDDDDALRKLEFDSWLSPNASYLRRLFIAFAATATLDSSIATISRGYNRVVKDDSGVVDALRVEDLIVELKHLVDSRCGDGSFDREFEATEKFHAGKTDRDFMLHCVSGKHFLLPLLKMRMIKICRIGMSNGVFKVNLADCASASELKDILLFAA